MKVYNEMPSHSLFESSVATIGNFDGVHKGHRELIEKTVLCAKEKGIVSVLITFEPHPVTFFGHKPMLPLTSMSERMALIEEVGIDFVFILPFTQEFAGQHACEFIENFLEDKIHCSTLFVGYDFRMGKDGLQGEDLQKSLKNIHCELEVVKEVTLVYENASCTVSSTKIREVLAKGQVELASALLGRPYSVQGIVVHGAKRGSTLLGFPTANMDTGELLLPKQGVYATSAHFPKKRAESMASISNIGYNPTFAGTKLVIETYILDFDQDIYGEVLEVAFHKIIREEKKFSSPKELIAQLEADRDFRRKLNVN